MREGGRERDLKGAYGGVLCLSGLVAAAAAAAVVSVCVKTKAVCSFSPAALRMVMEERGSRDRGGGAPATASGTERRQIFVELGE